MLSDAFEASPWPSYADEHADDGHDASDGPNSTGSRVRTNEGVHPTMSICGSPTLERSVIQVSKRQSAGCGRGRDTTCKVITASHGRVRPARRSGLYGP